MLCVNKCFFLWSGAIICHTFFVAGNLTSKYNKELNTFVSVLCISNILGGTIAG